MISLPIGRRGTTKLLYYAESPVKYAMFRPIHERLKLDPQVEVFFAGKLRGAMSSRAMAEVLGVEGARTIRRGLSALVKFDAFMTSDYEIWGGYLKKNLPISATPKIQIFHGASVRNGAIQPKMRKYHRLFVVGPYMHRAFVRAGIFEEGSEALVPVGMPKTDRFFDGSLDARAIRERLELDPAKPTVMLAPTYLRKSPLARYGEELLEALASGPWNFLIKLHDKFFDPRFNLIDWRRKLASIRSRPNVRVVEDYDAIPYLWVTDLLVSDVSSIANEFALLDRPLVYLEVEDLGGLSEQYEFMDLDTWGQRAGERVDAAGACRAAVERALADPRRHSDVRQALAADVFYNRGTAADAAVKAFYAMLAEGAEVRAGAAGA